MSTCEEPAASIRPAHPQRRANSQGFVLGQPLLVRQSRDEFAHGGPRHGASGNGLSWTGAGRPTGESCRCSATVFALLVVDHAQLLGREGNELSKPWGTDAHKIVGSLPARAKPIIYGRAWHRNGVK